MMEIASALFFYFCPNNKRTFKEYPSWVRQCMDSAWYLLYLKAIQELFDEYYYYNAKQGLGVSRSYFL